MKIEEIDFQDPDLYVDRVNEFTDALYNPNIRYIFLKGGAGSGKSHIVSQIILQNIFDTRIGCFRKTKNSMRDSCFQLLKDYRSDWSLEEYIKVKGSTMELLAGEGFIKMFGLDDENKIKSLADYDWFRIEETDQITYEEFCQLDLRLRGGINHKIICTFNPVSVFSWLKQDILDSSEYKEDAVWIEKTARDNKFVGEKYLANLDSYKYKNPSKYEIYALNKWGAGIKGLIFENYTVFNYDLEDIDSIGLDFGFNHPCALTYLKEDDPGPPKCDNPEDQELANKKYKPSLYIQEKIYKRGLTSESLIKEMERVGVPKDKKIYADGSRPEMIKDLRDYGYNIVGAKKGPGSVKDGIDNLLSYELFINGIGIQKEATKYVWALDKNDEPTDEPVKSDDDSWDSARYGHQGIKNRTLGFMNSR